MAKQSRAGYAEVSDIGTIPPIKEPRRRDDAGKLLRTFLKVYFPHSTGQAPFSDDHNRAIDRIQACIVEGGLFVNMFPRGFAKTSISEGSMMFAVLYAYRRFGVIIGAWQGNALGMLDSIQKELAENDLLYDDFPEVCHPIRALEGKAQRCASQHHAGRRTYIEWTTEKIALPMIDGSVAGGAVIEVKGITGAIRGLAHKMPNGVKQRPDFALIDDPQTTASASTDGQVKKRLDILGKDILNLGDHKTGIAAVMNATVIRRSDMADQVGDHKLNPAWQSERIKMLKRHADASETLWLDKYAEIRRDYDPRMPNDQRRAHAAATAFYKKNRGAMDSGCEVTWKECYKPGVEVSAVQHAYNILIDRGPAVFASECQNEPLETEQAAEGLKPEHLQGVERFNGVPLGTVPMTATRLIGHVDVMGKLLYWVVTAFDEHRTASIVAYGTWPDEPRPYFSMRDSKKSLRASTGADSDSAAIVLGVKACVEYLAKPDRWRNESGVPMAMDIIGVDSKWGKFVDEVFQVCRESSHRDILLPTQGKYYGVKSQRRLEDEKRLPGDRQGIGWRLNRNPAKCKRGHRWLLVDSNRWKTAAYKAMTTSPGSPGALMFNGRWKKGGMERHRLLSEHLTGEHWTEIVDKCTGRSAIEFTEPGPGREVHWWDNLYNCFVLADVQGVREPTAAPAIVHKTVSCPTCRSRSGPGTAGGSGGRRTESVSFPPLRTPPPAPIRRGLYSLNSYHQL